MRGSPCGLSSRQRILLREYPKSAAKAEVMHPGIDLPPYQNLNRGDCRNRLRGRFNLPLEAAVILFVSMNFDIKGLDRLMAGFAEFRKSFPLSPAYLLIVGKDDRRKYLKVAQDLGISDRVRFAGSMPSKEMPGVYCGSDGFSILSKFDTFGISVLEAMAASLPVIVSDRVGASDIVRHGQNGFIINFDQGESKIAEAISNVIRPERLKMGACARSTAQQFSWDKIAERMIQIYESVKRSRSGGFR